MSPSNEPRKGKAERTAEAREKARLIREEQAKKEKRNKLLVIWGVVVAAVVVLAIVIWSIMSSVAANAPIPDKGAAPANVSQYGGIVQTKDGVKKAPAGADVDYAALPPKTEGIVQGGKAAGVQGAGASAKGEPVNVVAYVDFICPACNQFEQQNSAQLKQAVKDGKITLEYRPLGFLDGSSTTNYSSRAAAAAYCVVNEAPDKLPAFFDALYAQQPPEGGAGLSNDQLKSIAKDTAGVDISACVDGKTYRPFVKTMTQKALNEGVQATPTVFVDGKQYLVDTPQGTPFSKVLTDAIDAKAKG